MKFNAVILIVFLSICSIIKANAQPSGGPYGPLEKTYIIPNISGMVYYVSPTGDLNASGKTINTPTTLKNAIANVVTGDAIILRGGIYRVGDLKLNQSILMQPYKNENPIIKGTYVASNWEAGGKTPYTGEQEMEISFSRQTR